MKTAPLHPLLMGLLRGTELSALLPQPSDHRTWNEITQEAEQQGLVFLLYRWVSEFSLDSVMPQELLHRLQATLFHQKARNLLLGSELSAILTACASRQVPCMPIRGPALAESLYGDATARPMGDLDLLVRRQDFPRVGGILKDLGFSEMDRRPGFSMAFSYTLKFIKDRHGWVIVEPHWTIAYPPFMDRLDMEPVWDRSLPGRVVGVDTRLLHPTDLVAHLCFHLVHRSDQVPLLWFFELDRVLRLQARDIDWDEVCRVALTSGQEPLLAEALRELQKMFASPVPKEVPTGLRSRPASAYSPGRRAGATRVEGRLVRMLAGGSSVDGVESFAMLLTLKGLRAKLRFAWALLFPTAEFMRLQYGLSTRRQVALSYVTRLGFLVREGLKGLGSLFLKERAPRRSPLASRDSFG